MSGHGGKRAGAGRKPKQDRSKVKTGSIGRFTAAELKRIDELRTEADKSRADVVRRLLKL